MASSGAEVETVFVVDDEDDVRDSLARLLRSAGLAVQTFASAQAFLEHPVGTAPGCLLLDVNMPGMTGPELHTQITARGIGLPIIYLTGRSNVAIGVRAMKQGALDFLEKPVDADELLAAIAHALQRSRETNGQREAAAQILARVAELSVREREVMDHVIRGRLNKQIAGDLGIAEKTVKIHRSRVMGKMQVRTVAALIHLCKQVGIGPAPTTGAGGAAGR